MQGWRWCRCSPGTTRLDIGRIFSYDVTGGRYEEHDYSVGSGSPFARGR